MSFAIDTVADFTQDQSPIAGRIGDDSPATEDAKPEGDQATEANLDEISVPADAVPPSDPTETPTDAPAVPAPAVTAESDDKWWAEIELLGKLAETERKRQEAASELHSLTAQRKDAKERHDGLLIEIQMIAAEMLDITTGKKIPVKPKAEQPAGDGAAEPEAVDNTWRTAATAELLDGTKGMGKKKLEAIVDAAPTVGHLEDLRRQASEQHKAFKDVLPKGCGQGLADAIEDRLVEHVAKWSTPPAHEQVKENAKSSAEDAPGDSTEEATTLDSMVAEIRQKAIDEEWGIDDMEVDQDDDHPETVEGFEAWDAGQPYVTCPYFETKERAKWVTGWVCGERRKVLQDSQPSGPDALAAI